MASWRGVGLVGMVTWVGLLPGCGGHGGGGGNSGPYPYTDVLPPAGGVAQFSVVPVAPAPGFTLTALGSLNPPGHVLPTDHVYFYAWDLSTGAPAPQTTRNVYMPATGACFLTLQTPGVGDWKVMFRATDNFYFYLDHVLLTTPIVYGQVVQAGTLIGTTDPGGTLDLGAFDQSVTNTGFIDPARYPFQTLYYVSPWAYFEPSLQPALYAQVYRSPTAKNKDGKIDFSVAGALVGDWFHLGLADSDSWDATGWSQTVGFVYDFYDPTQVRISIGGTVDAPGVWAIDPTAPDPATVTPASGLVAYRLLNPFMSDQQYGLMLVQMTDASTLQLEVFPGSTASAGQFDANSYTFVR